MADLANLDVQIAKARYDLLKLRETIIKEGDANQKKIDELKNKKTALDKTQMEVLDQGLDLCEYATIMKKANAKDNNTTTSCNSIAFGHQVLLLNTVHLMECREMAVRTSAKQGKRLVKFVERRKRALLEQNANHELLFANQLGEHYEKIKKLEEQYRQVIAAQQKAFWKIQSTAFPMIDLQPPTLSATKSEFVNGQRNLLDKTSSTRSLDKDRRTAKREASMRNLMEIESNTATEKNNLLKGNDTSRNHSLTGSSTDSFPSHIEFSMSLNDNSDTPKNTPKTPKRVRRLSRADSVDTLSTAGEELLNTIQGYFFGGKDEKNENGRSESLELDKSDRDWASMHAGQERRRSTTGESTALVV